MIKSTDDGHGFQSPHTSMGNAPSSAIGGARADQYNSHEYKAYAAGSEQNPDLWCKWSEKYINWRQLEILGIMSKGNWA